MLWKRDLVVLLFTAGLSGAVARAASFDCAKAKSPMERAICSDKNLSATDAALSTAYRSALSGLPAASVSKLRIDQLRWLQWLQTGCGVPGMATPGMAEGPQAAPSKEPSIESIARCMKGPYSERVEMLEHAVAHVGGVLFLTRSMYLLQPNDADDPVSITAQFAGFGELEAYWPEAQTSAPVWSAWNVGALHALQRAAWNDEHPKAMWNSAVMAGAVDASVSMDLPVIVNGRVSAEIGHQLMGHGAPHPNESSSRFWWLLAQGHALRPRDIFRDGTPWKRVMAQQCWKQLKVQKDVSFYHIDEGPGHDSIVSVVADPANWSFEKEGLVVDWPEYSVAPRVTPVDSTIVPWPVLRPYLAAGFQP